MAQCAQPSTGVELKVNKRSFAKFSGNSRLLNEFCLTECEVWWYVYWWIKAEQWKVLCRWHRLTWRIFWTKQTASVIWIEDHQLDGVTVPQYNDTDCSLLTLEPWTKLYMLKTSVNLFYMKTTILYNACTTSACNNPSPAIHNGSFLADLLVTRSNLEWPGLTWNYLQKNRSVKLKIDSISSRLTNIFWIQNTSRTLKCFSRTSIADFKDHRRPCSSLTMCIHDSTELMKKSA